MNIERVLRKDRLQGKERRYTQKEVDEIVKGKDKTLQSQYAVLKEVYEKYQILQEEHEKLKKKLFELENPDDGYRKDWTWVRKIVFVLEQAATALRTKEIIEILDKRELHLREHPSKEQYFSAFINMALKAERIKREKRRGERGFYYSIN
jgi:hypothetical protein